jgi:putative transposase
VACVDVVYDTKEEAIVELLAYMEVFYHRQRLHSKLGYLSPAAFEQQYHQLLNVPQSPVH